MTQAEQWDVGTKTDQEREDGKEGSASGPEALARGLLWQKGRERERKRKK